MELLRFNVKDGNFGDDLNDWFWDEALPGWRSWDADGVLMGVGTILKRGFVPVGCRKLVIGAGAGYGGLADVKTSPDEWDIRCVRGPQTAAALGVPGDLGIVDPAVLLADFHCFTDWRSRSSRREALFVPHYASCKKYNWREICRGTGLTLLDPSGDAKEIIARLSRAKVVIAESLHAAIVADAFGTPWRRLAISKAFNEFKWDDWEKSLAIDAKSARMWEYMRRAQDFAGRIHGKMISKAERNNVASAPVRFDPPKGVLGYVLESSARKTLRSIAAQPFYLSDRSVLAKKKAALWAVLDGVKRDYIS